MTRYKITAFSRNLNRRVVCFTYNGSAQQGIASAQARAKEFNVAHDMSDYQAEAIDAYRPNTGSTVYRQ